MTVGSLMQFVKRSCPICLHGEGLDHVDSPSSMWQLKTCGKCEFVYLQNPPVYAGLEQEFAWEKTYSTEKQRRSVNEPILNRVSKLVKFFRHRIFKRNKIAYLLKDFLPSGRVLDVGCGSGRQAETIFGREYEPWGIEISKALATCANEIFSRRGGKCIQGDAITGMSNISPEFFDGVVMLSYLEHELNPHEVCGAAFRCMRRGGFLFVKVPNYDSWNRHLRAGKWCGYRFPDHVNYFTPESLLTLINDAGFSIAKFNWFDRLPISDNMWLVARKP